MSVADGARIAAAALGERRWLDRAVLERHQDRLARRHLAWVVRHSPYTARRFVEAGLPLERWGELPTIGKPEMMAHFDELTTVGVHLDDVLRVAREAERSRDFTPTLPTSRGPVTVGLSTGTSGSQGAFVVDRRDRLAWAGVALRHCLPDFPTDLLRRQRIAFFLRAEGGLYRSVETRRLTFEFFDLLRPVDELAARLTALDPTLLVGPPSVLRAMAEAGGRARPRRVISVAEVLEPDDRELLEATFGPVVQVYQATEGMLALPCQEGSLHLNEAHVHVGLDPLGEGRFAPVVTDLRRRAQPMVRHRLDDVLVLADGCDCGSATRVVARIEGRCDDALDLAGRTIWPDFLRAALASVPGLGEYFVEQVAERELALAVEPDDDATWTAASEALRVALERLAPTGTTVALTRRRYRPPVAGAKRRRVTNRWKERP